MDASRWLRPAELRIGLGCMRLSSDEVDEKVAVDTIAAAVDSGITVFDTALAYGRGELALGENERLLAYGLRGRNQAALRVITKGGMTRAGGAWIPDGRARAIREDCEASLIALDGLPIDLYLLHAPDPRVPWRTSLRALARLADEGLVRLVGLSNVTVGQLDDALEVAPVAAVEVGLSVFDDTALRSGIVERCTALGIPLVAHSPLGGQRRRSALARHPVLAEVARAHSSSPAEVALTWLLAVSPVIFPIPGARRPETARSAARAAALLLDDDERSALDDAFGRRRTRAAVPPPTARGAEVTLVMGIPGAGKSHAAAAYVERGYVRLNRDERGGSLRELVDALEAELRGGASRVVLDNTWLSRATRSRVLDVAARHGAAVRCVWLDTPLAQAQVNVAQRLIEVVGHLPSPEELRVAARTTAGVMAPMSQMRAQRSLEPPSMEEGFAGVERVPFVRAASRGRRTTAVVLEAAVLERPDWQAVVSDIDPAAPHLVMDWQPDADAAVVAPYCARLAEVVEGPISGAVCPHRAGPPVCWCRPPLPGMAVEFAQAYGVELAACTVVGAGSAYRTLANAVGARHVAV